METKAHFGNEALRSGSSLETGSKTGDAFAWKPSAHALPLNTRRKQLADSLPIKESLSLHPLCTCTLRVAHTLYARKNFYCPSAKSPILHPV